MGFELIAGHFGVERVSERASEREDLLLLSCCNWSGCMSSLVSEWEEVCGVNLKSFLCLRKIRWEVREFFEVWS